MLVILEESATVKKILKTWIQTLIKLKSSPKDLKILMR